MNDPRAYGMSISGSSSRLKRKDRESSVPAKRQPPPPRRTTVTGSTTMTSAAAAAATKVKDEMTSSNKLLAGYMAYEYLTKGTLLGNKFDETAAKTSGNMNEKYKEITDLLMMNSESGVRVPNVVNPTQLARWIEM